MSNGVIFDIKRFAVHDGPGVRTTVFLKGCPLRCWSCHNPESQSRDIDLLLKHDRCNACGECLESCPLHAIEAGNGSVQIDRERCDRCGLCADACLRDAIEFAGRSVTVEQVIEEVEKDRVYYDEGGGGVTFSGGEPLYQPRFLVDLLRECARRDIATVVDTSGFASRTVVQTVAEWVDLFLYDLKLIDNVRHLQFTGATNRPILANLRWLADRGARVRVRFPLIPDINDDETNVRATGAFVASLPVSYGVDILPYHQLGVEKYQRLDRVYRLADTAVPNDGHIFNAVKILEAFGLDVTVKGETYAVEQ